LPKFDLLTFAVFNFVAYISARVRGRPIAFFSASVNKDAENPGGAVMRSNECKYANWQERETEMT